MGQGRSSELCLFSKLSSKLGLNYCFLPWTRRMILCKKDDGKLDGTEMTVVFRDWKPLKPHPSKHGFTEAAVHLVTSCVRAHIYLSTRYSADRISDVPRVKPQLKFLEGLRECSSSSATVTPGHSMTIYNGVCGFTTLQIVMQLTAVGEKNATLKHDILPLGHQTMWFVSSCEVKASGSQQWFQGVFLALSLLLFLSCITY